MRRLADWPLVAKFGVAPAFAVVLLLIMTVIEVVTLHAVRENTQHIVAVGMRDSTELTDIAARFERADADLCRLMTREAMAAGQSNVRLHTRAIRANLARVSHDLKAFQSSETGQQNARQLAETLRDVEKYKSAAEVLTAMLDINFGSAMAMIDPFHANAERVTAKLEAIARGGRAEANREAELVSARVTMVTGLFSILALVAVPLIALATFFIGIATVRSIRAIADATVRLAKADYDLDIKALEREDELGAVVAALETFRKQALEAMRLQAIEQKNHELSLAKIAAESASKAKSDFLANMSHELRTPLNAILGYADMLKRDHGLGERQSNAARTIHQSGSHLLTLITDILDLSKIEAGKLELFQVAFDLRGFLSGVADIIRIRTDHKHLTLACDPPADLPAFVEGDEKRLRQVLINLLGNAVKFTDHGSIELIVRVVSRSETMARIAFEVHDTGVGIAEDQLATIFRPFEQTGEIARRAGGTGLGLSISRELVGLMNSQIRVESTLGQGSRFWFELDMPIAEIGLAVLPGATTATGYRGPRRTVLIVDDMPENRLVMADMLELRGFETRQAADGLAGVESAKAMPPDLILMDVRMPVMDGPEAMRQLRQTASLASIPIIAVSAGVSPEEQARSLAAGADAFVAKPVVDEELMQAVGRCLKLEWVQGQPEQSATEHDDSTLLVAPPSEEIGILHKMAKFGNMRDIRMQAERLASLDARYQPFASKLLKLARACQSQAILELVEQYLEQGDGEERTSWREFG